MGWDHLNILPYDHWGGWTGAKRGTTLPDFADGQIHVVGNSIGNMRVWGSSLNRSDGSKSPCEKLKLEFDDSERAGILNNSRIDFDHIQNWKTASGFPDSPRIWSKARALAFQAAVEQRAASLYRRFYNDLDFSSWTGPLM